MLDMDKALGSDRVEVIMRILQVTTEMNAQSLVIWKVSVLFELATASFSIY